MPPKTEKRPFFADFLIKYKNIAWSDKRCRVFKLAEKFLNTKGAAIAFQKNAWNSLRSEKDAEYSIGAARAGKLKGTLKGRDDLTLLCVPPTRLAGPCRRVLTKMLKYTEAWA